MYYFYILHSRKDNYFYYGSTPDLKRRVQEHNLAKVQSTKTRIPLELVYYEAYLTEASARKRERSVKQSGSIRASLHKKF